MRAAERAFRAAMAALTDAEIRRLKFVDVSVEHAPGLLADRVSIVMDVAFPEGPHSGRCAAEHDTLLPQDINAALAAQAEKLARAQRPE